MTHMSRRTFISIAGVAGKHLTNPIPPDAPNAQRRVVPVTPSGAMDHPNPDPGEGYPQVNTQLYGTVLPVTNSAASMANPVVGLYPWGTRKVGTYQVPTLQEL